ncbi:MAG: hypothetical protein H7Y38_00630 [Armatimonadetes bacterium]|nr:hypothetical protein [Armatimonadota bacterium]
MATTRIAEEYLQSGWCARCGYKRTLRGNCPNCDHWYTHPVITVGGTIAACLTLLLFIGIKTVRDADPNFEKLSRGLLAAAPPVAYASPVTAPVRSAAPPHFYQSVAPVSVSFAKPATPAIEKQAGRLEELRETVYSAEQAYRSSTVSALQPGVSPRNERSTAIKAVSAIY